MTVRAILLALPLLVAGCAAAPRIAPPPPPAAPAPALMPPPPRAASGWRDAPLGPGAWRYERDDAGSTARFGVAGAVAALVIRCDTAARTVTLSRPGTAAGAMTITTSYGARAWPAVSTVDGRIGITMPARDPFLDELAFSRARFLIESPGANRLIIPVRAEPARVIEDCRA